MANSTLSTAAQSSTILTFILTYMIAFIILALLCYIFTSLGLYTMAKNKKLDQSWLAWIPFGNSYILGMLINKTVFFLKNRISKAQLVLPIFLVVAIVGSTLPLIGFIISVLYLIYYYAALYQLYKIYSPNHAVLFLILSIVIVLAQPIIIFAIRNRNVLS